MKERLTNELTHSAKRIFLNADGNSLTVVFVQSIPKAASLVTQVVKQYVAIATSSKLYRGSWIACRTPVLEMTYVIRNQSL